MTLQFDSALGALQEGGEARSAGERLQARLDEVSQLLGEDLSAMEEVLLDAALEGPEPAVEAARHLIARGGKRIRPLSLILAARCFRPQPTRAHLELAAVVELVHSATLLHDDVVDEGMERRGAPTSRRIHGNGVSVLSGDLLLVNALGRTRAVAPGLLGDLIDTLRALVDGEIIQLRGRTELDVSERTYYSILENKTASLFAFSARAGAWLADAPKAGCDALADFGRHLGIAFQLVDDVIDYEGEQTGKTLFADLLEGKMTLPLVLAIEHDPDLADIVARIHRGDESVVSEVSRRVRASESCTKVRERAQKCTREAIAALHRVPDCPARDFLRVVAEEMTTRSA